MIPLRLSLSGFLSYRDPVELDFTSIDLACIAGANGAGKSSLLDAITWALFGKARKQDDSLINAQSKAAEVSLIFEYEGNIYRIQRTKLREKTGLLEFHLLQPQSTPDLSGAATADFATGSWKALTEHGLTATNQRIQQTLRLDYETFINASFFLQGKADQFTQQSPGDRKRILGSLLGLEIWEVYRQGAAARRKSVEEEIISIEGQLREIQAELSEEEPRRARLKQLEMELERLSAERASQEALLDNIRKVIAALAEQEKWVEDLRLRLEQSAAQLEEQEQRLLERQEERASFSGLIERAAEIESAHQAWLARRDELGILDRLANQFRQQEAHRIAPREVIQSTRASLEKELQLLQAQQIEAERRQGELLTLNDQEQAAQGRQAELELQLAERQLVDASLVTLREQWTELKNANAAFEKEIAKLHKHREELSGSEGALCPLCGQPLSPDERLRLIDSFAEQAANADLAINANQEEMKRISSQGDELKKGSPALEQIEKNLRLASAQSARLSSQFEALERQQADWLRHGAPRLEQIAQELENETYAPEARAALAQIDADLRQIGYDPQRHEELRQAEAAERQIEEEMRTLERARATLAPLQREIGDLDRAVAAARQGVAQQKSEYQQQLESLETSRAQAPDQDAAERALLTLQENENLLRREVGSALQRVSVLESQKKRNHDLQGLRQELARQVTLYKQLERAFGKDGVPALLIEQALPQLEARANDILDRLSNGTMSVRFSTQAAYKDKVRQDLKETLDIQISDGSGTRDYELFSGGEAFRVNFAIRLALSELLAQRAGARLQTLVIDEGFGSQDTQGRQRLIEAINLVRPDFAKILVITHIDELKDAFPNRIEVEKTENGSTVRILS
jgi:exonuclease SbcC